MSEGMEKMSQGKSRKIRSPAAAAAATI